MKFITISAIWCPACLIMRSKVEDAKKNFKEYEYVEYDYDLDEEEVKKYNVTEILPVFIIEKDGVEVKRLIGEKSKEELIKFMEVI